MEQKEAGAPKRRYLTRRFWRSALGFWSRHGDRAAWLLTIALLIVIVTQLAIQYQLTVWNRSIFDALEKRDGHAVLVQSLVFPALAAVSVVSWMLVVYARLTMERHWRAWMNAHVVDRWLGNGHYYQLNFVQGEGHKTPNTASPTMCVLPPNRRSNSPPGSPRRCSLRLPSWSCCGASAAHCRSIS